MISVYASNISGTMALIFEKEIVEKEDLKEKMKIGIKILGISRKDKYFERNVYIRRSLKQYSTASLKMTIIKKYAEPLGLKDGDIVNIEILEKKY
ncbi:MAG: hypothetical protein BAJALOKI2v1_30001 [Promethearchaeota archaeon]|nr:MAG: hypothetical protein BAJALOKI2v1_30001 [Candidatus Lokiarchaeota archaeon]